MNASDTQRFDRVTTEAYNLMMELSGTTAQLRHDFDDKQGTARLLCFAEGAIAGGAHEIAKAAWYKLFPGRFPPHTLDAVQLDKFRDWFNERVDGSAPADGLPCTTIVNVWLDTAELLMNAARTLQEESKRPVIVA